MKEVSLPINYFFKCWKLSIVISVSIASASGTYFRVISLSSPRHLIIMTPISAYTS